jgi:hypothetical protein
VRVVSDAELHELTEGAIAASHAAPTAEPLRVAPASQGQKHKNTIRERLVPLACWRGEELLFDFDSSFVRPDTTREIRLLKTLREKHAVQQGSQLLFPTLSVFGHADPTGNDDYNKQLSGRRATAIYALLVRDTNRWEKLFSTPLGRDDWHKSAVATMEKALGRPAASGPAGRKALFAAYMDLLCGADFRLDPHADFLARGADAGRKGDVQGCGELNPVLILSRDEKRDLDRPERQEERNAENEPNRRVVVFLFRPGLRVSADHWPCPRASEGIAACRKRFWSDGEKRRAAGDARREHPRDRDTFACRFYDRLAGSSPCEVVSPVFRIRLYDAKGRAVVGGSPFRVQLDNELQARPVQQADAQGFAVVRSVPAPTLCTLDWNAGPAALGGDEPPALPFRQRIFLQLAPDEEIAALQRLNNLGYAGTASRDERIVAFKKDHPERFAPSEIDARLDARTQGAIRELHDGVPDETRLGPEA